MTASKDLAIKDGAYETFKVVAALCERKVPVRLCGAYIRKAAADWENLRLDVMNHGVRVTPCW